jgi:adenosylcobinamide kinase/adenosylcobinamide-phosphate guanylyltransferase
MPKKGILILGGARSGKSSFAQQMAGKLGQRVLFVATGEPLDDEMQARISEHKKSRPREWRTIETPGNVTEQIKKHVFDADVVLIDCLTLLVSNLLSTDSDYVKTEGEVLIQIENLVTLLKQLNLSWVIVSNEVGMGIVPETRLGRVYRDILGKVNQLVAIQATEVYFMISGIPVKIKG